MRAAFGFLAAALVFFAGAGNAWARAEIFRGAYPIVSQTSDAAPPKYFVCDVDTVAHIWAKYGEGDLPPDLVKIKDQLSILAAFNFRQGLFFTLDANALVTPNFLALPGPGNNRLELHQRPDGQYDLGVRIDGVTNVYVTGPRENL